MIAICIDDEKLILRHNVNMLKTIPPIETVEGFLSAQEALAYLEEHPVDVVFADIELPDMNGMDLAALIRQKWPETAVIFLTGYSEYAVPAYKSRPNGFLLKPVKKSDFEDEILNVEDQMRKRNRKKIRIITFGNFEVLVNDRILPFSRSRAKEILAYLVCKNGSGVSRPELAAVLWEDEMYDHSKQKQLDVFIRSLISTLRDNQLEELVELNHGILRIRPEMVECDYYQFLKGDIETRKRYTGEFMNAYSWAEYMKDVFEK